MKPLYRIINVLDHDGEGWSNLGWVVQCNGWIIGSNDLRLNPSLLFNFTQYCLHRIFVFHDVPTRRKPRLNLYVPVQERGSILNDEPRRREVSGEGHETAFRELG